MPSEQTAYQSAYQQGGELLRGTAGEELAGAADVRRAADSDVADAMARPRP